MRAVILGFLEYARVASKKSAEFAQRLLLTSYSGTRNILSNCHRLVRNFEPWGIFLTLFGVGIALVTIVVDLEDRQAERTFRAWQLIVTAPSTGSSTRAAFEYLNREFEGFFCGKPIQLISITLTGNRHRICLFPRKERESLAGIKMAGATLPEANLSGANLREADLSLTDLGGVDLSGADLSGANLSGADLSGAVLPGANLSGADLSGADLRESNMSGANLMSADLSGAYLGFADLPGADLSSAILSGADLGGVDLSNANVSHADLESDYLIQPQLDAACGYNAPRRIPVGLTWRSGDCPERNH